MDGYLHKALQCGLNTSGTQEKVPMSLDPNCAESEILNWPEPHGFEPLEPRLRGSSEPVYSGSIPAPPLSCSATLDKSLTLSELPMPQIPNGPNILHMRVKCTASGSLRAQNSGQTQ